MITQGERVKSAALWAGRRRATTDHCSAATVKSENDTAQLGVSNCWSEKERESEGATICRWRCWWWPGDFKQYTAVYTAYCIHGARAPFVHYCLIMNRQKEKGCPSVRQTDRQWCRSVILQPTAGARQRRHHSSVITTVAVAAAKRRVSLSQSQPQSCSTWIKTRGCKDEEEKEE